ncbi:uncharacterized protein [Procambarus clarkii]|uniref:uncharacterized protein n=1 Tax=Procambarus clarkii TaxID=6728 RepID=UPI0037430C77
MSSEYEESRNIYIRQSTYNGGTESQATSTDVASGNNNDTVADVSVSGVRGHKGLTVGLGAMFLIGEMAGAGVLNLPRAIANTWWVGVPLLVVLTVAVGYSGTRLALCWVLLEERWPEYNSPCRRPYPAIAFRALGKPGQIVTEVALGLTLFGAGTVYLLLASQLIRDLVGQLIPSITECAWSLIIGLSLIPISWLGTPKDFWPASVVAVSSTFLACLVVIGVVIARRDNYDPALYPAPTFNSFFLGFGSILFALGGASIFPTIQNDMRVRSEFPQCVIITFLVLLALYLPMVTVCYGVLGANGIHDNILLAVSGWAVTVTQAFLFCHFIFAFSIIVNPLNQTLEGLFNLPNRLGVRRCLLRTGVLLVVMLVSLAVPEFSKILDFVGGSTVALLSFVLPPLCYLRLCAVQGHDGLPLRELKRVEKVVLTVIVGVGVAGGVAATWSALREILSPGAFTTTCFSSATFLD